MKPELNRQAFTTSRELEYFTESELTTQTGCSKQQWWPGVVAKELVDNALDACEQAGVAPVISVDFSGDSIRVTDNGPGLAEKIVRKSLDFSTRTSDKQLYISPTRGAQGNALKTVFAIPYVLSGRNPGTIAIDSCGVHHRVAVSTDEIARRPQIAHGVTGIVKTEGCSIQVVLNSACSKAIAVDPHFLQKLLFDYSLFNPHATFTLREGGQQNEFKATNPGWKKWLPSDPTCAHWYTPERFQELVAAYVAAERNGKKHRTVREFVAEFRGLSGTAKQGSIISQVGLDRVYLHDFASNGKLDAETLCRLLRAMQHMSKPVKPAALGLLGESHFRERIHGTKAGGESFRYKRSMGIDPRTGLPFVIEAAFNMTEDGLLRGRHVGLNWSVPLGDPVQQVKFGVDNERFQGLSALLARNQISLDHDGVCLVLHLISPRFSFLDRGKGSVDL